MTPLFLHRASRKYTFAFFHYPSAINLLSKRHYHETKETSFGFKSLPQPSFIPEAVTTKVSSPNLLRWIESYRKYGHKFAQLDPLRLESIPSIPNELRPENFGLQDKVNVHGVPFLQKYCTHQTNLDLPIKLIEEKLDNLYCRKIGYEFSHIPDTLEQSWFINKIEEQNTEMMDRSEKLHLQSLLTKSECFDLFMTKKFPLVKRYGLEGAESMLVSLDTLFRTACHSGVNTIVIGMPHRGRLNLLATLLDFPLATLFAKLQGVPEFPTSELHVCTGDVLSHLAQSVQLEYGSHQLNVSLLHNPSHLEAINPVAVGKTRAKQIQGSKALCLQVHGDAAFSSQGIVMETLILANLPHYTCSGSIHLVINNQIGYTTPIYNARSTRYCTDPAKIIDCPILHVNGDAPEEVSKAMKIAVEYRSTFHKDVIVDLVTFRRWGHNEVDEPSFTQPLMYNAIKARPSIPTEYTTSLTLSNVVSEKEIEAQKQSYFKEFDEGLAQVNTYSPKPTHLNGKWNTMISPKENICTLATGISESVLNEIGRASVTLPAGFNLHPRLEKHHVQARLQKLEKTTGLDWATAEAMAFGSLLKEGYFVRLSGQDVGRGTFSQRHCMFVDQTNESICIPLNQLGPGQLEVANSPLSEWGVLGFEFGVSWESPQWLILWEAQFGDFFNTAQVIIDTFISSSEAKWLRQSGLVLLLPHGYYGAGPEHSSCRLERFLQLTTEGLVNMHVVYPTTPAQYFHLLRRQMVRPYRKPLIVVGPKMLLKLPAAVSALKDMSLNTSFQPVIEDDLDPHHVRRLVFCTGKLFYELYKLRSQMKAEVALIRIEELAPFPLPWISTMVQRYPHVNDFVWCQEEPENQGAYTFIAPKLNALLSLPLKYVGRKSAAAPATGVSSIHRQEQETILNQALSF